MRRIFAIAILLAVSLLLLLVDSSTATVSPVSLGNDWDLLALDGFSIQEIAVDRQDANTLHVIAGGTHMVSNDRGLTWHTVPSDPRPFYAQDLNQPQTYFRWSPLGTLPGGIQRSTNNSQTWSLVWSSSTVNTGGDRPLAAPPPGPGVPPTLWTSSDYFEGDIGGASPPPRAFDALAVAFGEGQLLFLAREQSPVFDQVVSNLWQSPDDGRNWFPLFPDSLIYPQSPYLTSMALWPGAPTRILLGTNDGLFVRDLPVIQHSYLSMVNKGAVAGW